jgi:heparanase 1
MTASGLVRRYFPESRFTGQASAHWPVLGEPLSFLFRFQESYLKHSGELIDLVAWHYYPQQSRREPVASRRADPARLLSPENLDEAAYWADQIITMRDRYAPGKPIWLGESGNAQAGGEPGVSDVYIGGLWWLDQLGLLARKQHQVIVRQTLSGSDYGILEDHTLEPRPDFWNSLLWKRLMGTEVFAAQAFGENVGRLRVYAHSSAPGAGGDVTVLAINLDHQRSVEITFPELSGSSWQVYRLNAPDVLGKIIYLNGEALKLGHGQVLPELGGFPQERGAVPKVWIHPLSYSFIVLALEGRKI